MAPGNLGNDQVLYDRLDSSVQLLRVLTGALSVGVPLAAIMDQNLGCGKTSLGWKFRSVLSANGITIPVPLRDAVYLHIKVNGCIQAEKLNDFKDYDRSILFQIGEVLRRSCNDSTLPLDVSAVDLFCSTLFACSNGVKFIFHFDEVGDYEGHIGDELARNMFCRLWNISERLKIYGNYYLFTGRSRILHDFGIMARSFSNGYFSSPGRMVIINLPLLTSTSIKAIFAVARNSELVNSPMFLEWVQNFTFGVPRAICVILEGIERLPVELDYDSIIGQLEGSVLNTCNYKLDCTTNITLFRRCLELSWANIHVPVKAKMGGEPITGIIATLGLCAEYVDGNTLVRIIAPEYIIRLYNCSEH